MNTIVGKVYTVSEVNRIMKGLIRQEPEFANLQIQGEVSNFRQYPSGHCYFALKDGKTLLKCVMFAGSARRLKQLPRNGDQILGVGRIDLYERDGIYQFYVDMLMPLGAGSLMVAYEQLKQKLSAEGLFDESRKKTLPVYPKTVGIVTSPAGAAVRDIINVSGRRDPSVKLLLYPVKVQGTEAPLEIVHGIQFFNHHQLADVLIVGRGGGSMEDLWAFNDERVVRTIAESEIPVVSAVGHEIDFTLSDFAADLRAPTPSAAAELAVPERSGDREALAKLARRLERAMEVKLTNSGTALERLQEEWVLTHPERLWEMASQTLDTLDRRLEQAAQSRFTDREQELQLLATKLETLDPYAVLRRGYTITENERGQVVHSAARLQPGATLVTRFTDGTAVSTVDTVKEG
ncbi:exodeoxyribonuclease VII large subunit [Acidaminococcus sp.]|uniref:exodeoxyribonuclease VII large subunit n=1 Tax=Acidaminococcus sp. TaxID=1872103 RepID=UPI003D7C3D35